MLNFECKIVFLNWLEVKKRKKKKVEVTQRVRTGSKTRNSKLSQGHRRNFTSVSNVSHTCVLELDNRAVGQARGI